MSGHSPTILEISPTPQTAEVALHNVSKLLHENYAAQLQGSRHLGARAFDSGSIVLGGIELIVEIALLSRDGALFPMIEIDSKAYEATSYLEARRPRQSAKQQLIDLCVALAQSLDAEAFRLRFRDSAEMPLSVSQLSLDMSSFDPKTGLLVGLALNSAALPPLRPRWSSWAERNGYAILSFL